MRQEEVISLEGISRKRIWMTLKRIFEEYGITRMEALEFGSCEDKK